MPRDVTVIGAGIVGICCATYLQRDGHRVTVVDPLPPGEGCSFGNAGSIAPGWCAPWPGPKALQRTLRWLLDPEGPVRIRGMARSPILARTPSPSTAGRPWWSSRPESVQHRDQSSSLLQSLSATAKK